MDFVVDKVSEDSFYINVLAGLPKQLDKFKKLGVTTRHLSRKLPVAHSEICAWEQKQSILLPEDLRNFYNSCNGFLFTWTFQFGNDKKEIMGRLEVNELENLAQLNGYESRQDPGVSTNLERFELRLGVASRLFELVKLDETSKVVLVYLNSRYSPTIWVWVTATGAGAQEFYFLADDFTTYFRMSLAHVGIPSWQLLFTPQGVPQWTENMIRILAPHLLKPNRTVESARKRRDREVANEHVEVPINHLDIGIFKCLPRLPHGLPRVVEKEKTSPRGRKRPEVREREKSFTLPKSALQRKK